MTTPPSAPSGAGGGGVAAARPYPPHWEDVADLRVFRTTAGEWEKLIGWRNDMRKRGWKLLKVSSEGSEMVAIFGRTKEDRSS